MAFLLLAITTNYNLHSKNIVHMTQGSNELHFFYDAQNKPAVVVYNGTPYSYVKNLQGDIVAILDSNKNVVVSYVYDAWGRPVSCSGTMASTLGKINPFRYRGYVYDEETELYYLRSRYYSCWMCRFLNCDVRISGNVYGYTCGNPIMYSDSNGMSSTPALSEDNNGFWKTIVAYCSALSIGLDAMVTVDRISIDLANNQEALLYAYDTLGLDQTSHIITLAVDAKYLIQNGKEFAFTQSCMEYEIREHIHAYLFATELRDVGVNAIAAAYYAKQWLEGKNHEEVLQAIVEATASTDLRESDVNDPYQSLFFNYDNNIRPSRQKDIRQRYLAPSEDDAYYGY